MHFIMRYAQLKIPYYPERKIENPEMATAAAAGEESGATGGTEGKLDGTFNEFIKEVRVYCAACSSAAVDCQLFT